MNEDERQLTDRLVQLCVDAPQLQQQITDRLSATLVLPAAAAAHIRMKTNTKWRQSAS